MSSWTPAEIERRKPLWVALADLFLDTEVRGFLPRIALVAVEGRFRGSKVWEILDGEVAPVVGRNRLSVAGEWAGFNADWLCRRIEAAGPPGKSITRKLAGRLSSVLHSEFRGPLYNLVDYLSSHAEPQAEQSRLTSIASLYIERRWSRSFQLWSNLKGLSRYPVPVLKSSFDDGIEPSYFALLRPQNGDPTEAEARQNWHWFLHLLEWNPPGPEIDKALVVAAAEQLSFLFFVDHLAATPRARMVREKLKATGLPRSSLERLLQGPLAALYSERRRAEANWRGIGLDKL